MRNFFNIWRKELSSCFLSPIAYIVLIVIIVMSNWMFWNATLSHEGTDSTLTMLIMIAILFFSPILIAVVTMRLFAEERRSGTLESLLTAPVTEVELVLGKYAGALSFLVIVMVPVMSTVYILQFLAPGLDKIVPGELGCTALLIFLFYAYCTSLGLLASLMTRNQVVAGICCFCASLVPFMVSMALPFIPWCPDNIVEYFSVANQVTDFAMGSLDIRPVILYVSLTMYVLFVSVQVLQSRRWR